MKVKFKYGIRTYSGTLDEMTYGSYLDHRLCIGRRYVSPELNEHHEDMGEIMKNVAVLFGKVSEGYASDLKTYASKNAKLNRKGDKLPPNSYALFVKMLFAWAEENSATVDLASIQIDDIRSSIAPVTKVSTAVDAGYLRKVSGYELLDTDI